MGKQKAGGISWTDRTWNPLRGCTRISEGCRFCYAEKTAARFSQPGAAFHGFALPTADGPRWTGLVELIDHILDEPPTWREPQTVFVNSMSDTWHPAINPMQRAAMYEAMIPPHLYLVLTKRPELMRAQLKSWIATEHPAALFAELNCWHGVSVENQQAADERIPILLDTPAAHRFLSCEPLIGPVNLKPEWLGPGKIEWVIVGGESGPGARLMTAEWAVAILETCQAAGAKIHLKQMGDVWAMENRLPKYASKDRNCWPNYLHDFPRWMPRSETARYTYMEGRRDHQAYTAGKKPEAHP